MDKLGKIVTVKLEVKSCRECPHASNSAKEHNDPFSSTPLNVYWYCNQGTNTRETVNITNSYEIAKNCPLRKQYGKYT